MEYRIFKIQIKELTGKILGACEILSDEDAFWVDGILLDVEDEAFGLWVIDNLEEARSTKYFNFQTENFKDRPIITAEPDKTELTADGVDSIIISGLPIPCTVIVDDEEYQMDDPEDDVFEWSTPLLGTYTIKIDAWPHQDWEREVTAT